METYKKPVSVLYAFCGPEKGYRSLLYYLFYNDEVITPMDISYACRKMVEKNPDIKEIYWVDAAYRYKKDWNEQFRSFDMATVANFHMDISKVGFRVY